ncbi:hypothetical protein ACSBR1_034379 [Camellia fascicularis]
MISNGVEDEEKWLAAGIAGLQQNAFYMHRALDFDNLRDALKYSAQMLSEFRTSQLSPHKYYDLYMRAFDELRKLEMPDWYKEKVYPPNKVPSLEHNNEIRGESLDLLKYIDSYFEGPALYPDDPTKREFAEELLSYTNTLNLAMITSLKEGSENEISTTFDYLESTLFKFTDGPFFLGQFSLVDIAYAPFIERFYPLLLDVKKYDITTGRPMLTSWIEAALVPTEPTGMKSNEWPGARYASGDGRMKCDPGQVLPRDVGSARPSGCFSGLVKRGPRCVLPRDVRSTSLSGCFSGRVKRGPGWVLSRDIRRRVKRGPGWVFPRDVRSTCLSGCFSRPVMRGPRRVLSRDVRSTSWSDFRVVSRDA